MANRIQESDTTTEALFKMAEGNPGAAKVLVGFLQRQGNMGIIHLAKLDDNEIYGTDIWVLWKDICKEDADTFDNMIIHNKIYDKEIREAATYQRRD